MTTSPLFHYPESIGSISIYVCDFEHLGKILICLIKSSILTKTPQSTPLRPTPQKPPPPTTFPLQKPTIRLIFTFKPFLAPTRSSICPVGNSLCHYVTTSLWHQFDLADHISASAELYSLYLCPMLSYH